MSDRPIRVLRVIARLNVGGPSLHVSYLTAELDRIGYETTLAAGRVGEHEGSMEYVARELGVEPVIVPSLRREISPLDDISTIAHLRRMIERLRPDVLHTHTAKAGTVGRAAALLAGPHRPKAIVHTFHGHVLRGYFSPAVAAGFLRVERTLARHTDALVAVSPEVRDDLVRLGVAPAERIAVIRLGLDLEGRAGAGAAERRHERESLGVADGTFLVGWLGRFTEIKRVDDLLRAFALLRGNGVDAELVLSGDGPGRRAMEDLAAKLGVAGRCHFLGFREDVGPLLAACDAVALTSANEGTPVTLIEALAAGRPVVATDVGGVADVVRHGESGFLVPPGDTGAVAAQLAVLAGDPGLRGRLGESGRAYVGSRYSVPRLVSDVDLLYRSLLEVRAPTSRRVVSPMSERLSPVLPPERIRRVPTATRRLRIVLVSQYFPPEVGATQSRMQAFAEYLAARGHRVTVVAEFPNHPHGVIPDRYRGRIAVVDRSNPYRVVRVWVKASPTKTPATRVAFYASYTAMAAAAGSAIGRADIVVATSPPLLTGLAGLAIARRSRAPFVLDVRDLWPAAAGALGQMSDRRTHEAMLRLERLLYREAASVVAVTRPFCEHVDRVRARPPATALIPNGTLDLFFVNGDRSGRGQLGIPDDRFLVTFAGTLGIAQALPSVLEAATLLDETAHVAFVGDGPVKETLVDRAGSLGLTNVSFHGQLPIEAIPPVLAASDALLVPLSAHPVFADFVPSKLVDFMAVGRPVLVSAAGEPARLLERARAGLAVPPEDPDALAGAARWLAEHPDEAAAMGAHGRRYAGRRLRILQAERLEQLLLDVAAR